MTIDEAIKHCLEVAEQNEFEVRVYDELSRAGNEEYRNNHCQCAADHRQLAEWLTELKDLREENKVLTSECDRLIKEKGELLSKVSGGDVLRICQLEEQLKDWKEEYANLNKISYGFYEELKEAKRLLKSATNVLNMFIPCDEDYNCSECIKQRQNCDYDDSFKWRYTDEALALIGEDGDSE